MPKIAVRTESYICLAAALWLMVETVYAVLQILGILSSNNELYPLTGSFNNPGPYGGFIGMLSAICAAQVILYKGGESNVTVIRTICGMAFLAALIVLPASGSRAGALGLCVALAVIALRNTKTKCWLKEKKIRPVFIVALCLSLCVFFFFLKKDSALGRLHIWHMEIKGILNAPLKGSGIGSFHYAYGETQASYFSSAPRAAWEIRVAGSPEYAFNEYLKMGVEMGAPLMLLGVGLTLLVCVLLIRGNNPMGYGALALSVFSGFSYPLELWQFQLFGVLFVCSAIWELRIYKLRWAVIPLLLFFCMLFAYSTVKKKTESSYKELFHKGYSFFELEQYKIAVEYLKDGSSVSCDPMFHNIAGRCYEALGMSQEAEEEYIHAHHMVPGRLYPLVLLQELYINRKDTLKAMAVYSSITDIPVNSRNVNMVDLRARADSNANFLRNSDDEE